MKHLKTFILIFYLPLMISSCTKVIDLKFGNGNAKLVIEGNITNSAGPQVIKLSMNVPFTNPNSYPAISDATVMVTDQSGNTFQFNEGPTGKYSNSQLTGIPGNTYTMKVFTNGINYIAVSKMPQNVNLDSLIAEKDPATFGSTKKKQVSVFYHDPASVGNQYRFVEYINGVQVKKVFAFNDHFNDGLGVYVDLSETDIEIHSGNTVKVEMQCIDQPSYLYWLTLAQQEENGPSGSITPSNPPTNIIPATFGYFSAHTTQTKSMIVP